MRSLALSACAAALAVLTSAAVADAGPFGTGSAVGEQHETSNCFWFGPTFSATNQQLNYAFPDSGALYWAAQFELPEDATLTLKGRFAHARYQSLNSYDVTTNAPTAAVNDVSTRPDPGSRNPFQPGADRGGEDARSYTVDVVNRTAPADPAPNTLYAGVPGQRRTTLIYRLYLPDRGRDSTGGVGLPQPEVHFSDGRTLSGESLCDALRSVSATPQITTLPAQQYAALRDQPGKPDTFPADRPPVWRTFYNQPFTLGCVYLSQCSGSPDRTGGQYSNIDNNYVNAYVSRKFGEVLTLTGTMPRTPRTLDGQQRLDGQTDLRYWSLCANESVATTRVSGCVYDEQVPLGPDRRYTVVASLPSQRPANAIAECGVAWVPLPDSGDGAGHPDDAYLILRNMLPAPGFAHAVQDTRVPGDEKATMGDYLPDGTYSSKTEFEARGCHPAG